MQNHNQAMNQVPAGALNQSVRISSKEFQAKYNSKRECYNFLATDCGVFLPPYDNVTSKYPLAQRKAPPRCPGPFLIIC